MATTPSRDAEGQSKEVFGSIDLGTASRGSVVGAGDEADGKARQAQVVHDPACRRLLEEILVVLHEIRDRS